jgi:hypothetical protein
MDVAGKRVANYEEANATPGAFWWTGEPPKHLSFVCPCGCGNIGGVAVGVDPLDRNGNHPVWEWNGDLDKPTVMPSIEFLTGCRWHGFLNAGVFKSV